ncbi:hypothetical protein FNV43_RR08083 [Rhamnella rubrinervis]|uniref:Acyl carrier protein n=1 Tax=Rhamnella rubrinervis TaxID=2594499 RepID=A0A8K0MMY3_9ROSA|nr:hypothetical protein FNV43_RR08083 [Rhamnella rubrinervis]
MGGLGWGLTASVEEVRKVGTRGDELGWDGVRWRGSIGQSKIVIFTGVTVGFAGLVGNVGGGHPQGEVIEADDGNRQMAVHVDWRNGVRCTSSQHYNLSTTGGAMFSGLRLAPKIKITKSAERLSFPLPGCFKSTISCSIADPETLKTVQTTIAKQLSIDETTVTPSTKFADLGADSLDTVEIMMALEEKFGVSIGEEGAENIATVQDAADLIEKVKAAAN